ncbi:glycine cleavage system H protein [Hepatocystis sp. ex Piliocolobus tephrosceles]|nr:glycine cleavage system H protein [Hepatocystis sp. ex Piliocolobus tephrosceles]
MLTRKLFFFRKGFLLQHFNSCYLQFSAKHFITYYTASHEYIKINDENLKERKTNGDIKCKIGISKYGTEKLGEIVFIDVTQKINDHVKKGDCIATIESVKSVGDVYTPISGKIININNQLIDNVNLINKNPESDGWIMELLAKDINETEIMDNSEYKQLCEKEEQNEETTLQQSEINYLKEKKESKLFDVKDIERIQNKEEK